MNIRKYKPGEEAELWRLYFHTIRNVNLRDYTWEQVRAWAPEHYDEANWRARMQGIDPYVCICDNQVVGYADLQPSGYIDHFFVHHQWQGRGVGKRLMQTIEAEALRRNLSHLSADVSITARPFFESRGFAVVATQRVDLGAATLTNFKMTKALRREPIRARLCF